MATTIQASGCNRKTDNFMLVPNKFSGELQFTRSEVSQSMTSAKQRQQYIVVNDRHGVANTVTSHYAKEKTTDLLKNTWGGELRNEQDQLQRK